jgi:hypothetical protein
MKLPATFFLIFVVMNSYGKSSVSGAIYIQEKWDQPISTMRFFPFATVSASGSNETVTQSGNGSFTLEFPTYEKGSEVYIRIPEKSLVYNGDTYEVVNTNSLRAITGTGEKIIITVCRKGMRARFEQQIAENIFRRQLNKAADNQIIKELVLKTTALVLSNAYTKNSLLNTRLREKVDAGNYFDAKLLLAPVMEQAFKYLQQEKNTGLHHEQLYNSSIESIQAYIYTCILCYSNLEGIKLFRKLYDNAPEDFKVIEAYGSYLRYLEYYDEARKIYQEGQVARITPSEKGSINVELVKLYNLLDKQDSARYTALATIDELNRLPYQSLQTMKQVCYLYYSVAFNLEFDTCIFFYKKALEVSRRMLYNMSLPERKKEITVNETDSCTVYYFMCGYYADLNEEDSAHWCLENSYNYMMAHNQNGAYTKNIDNVKNELFPSKVDNETTLSNLLKKKGTNGNSYEKAIILNELALIYISRKEFKKARNAIAEELNIYKEIEKKDLPFRKLRLRKSTALKTLAACIFNESNIKIDSAIFYYNQALAVLSDNEHLIRESYGKEIAEGGKDILEWMNIGIAGQQGLMKMDKRLLANKKVLDAILSEADRIYEKNPAKYAAVVCASYLYGASIYSTNAGTTSQATIFANKAMAIANNNHYVIEDKIVQKGYDALAPYLIYPDVVFGLLGNMYWLRDSLSLALEFYSEAVKQEKEHPELAYMLPLSRIYYDMDIPEEANTLAFEGYKKIIEKPNSFYTVIINHYLFMQAAASARMGKYARAFSLCKELMGRDLSNYAFAGQTVQLAIITSNKMEKFDRSIQFAQKFGKEQYFEENAGCAIEAAWAFACKKDSLPAIVLLENIKPQDLEYIEPEEKERYKALNYILSGRKNGSSKINEVTIKDTSFSNIQYYLDCATLFSYNDKNDEADNCFILCQQEEGKISNERTMVLYKAARLKQQGLHWVKKGNLKKAKEAFEDSLAIYVKYIDEYPYECEQLTKWLTE